MFSRAYQVLARLDDTWAGGVIGVICLFALGYLLTCGALILEPEPRAAAALRTSATIIAGPLP